jgi:hypothetical protein
LFLIALLLVVAVVLFYALQKYIVYGQDGLSLELPFFSSETAAPAAGTEGASETAVAELQILAPDFSSVAPVEVGDLQEVHALYIPAASVSVEGLSAAAAAMEKWEADTLVLEMKPASGELVWPSRVHMAEAYGVAGRADLSEELASLKEEGVYLVAEISCCVDDMIAIRNLPVALRSSDGTVYHDDIGYWLDPYNKEVRAYITELCVELAGMGFDEVLLRNLAHPDAEVSYSQPMSGEPNKVAAVSALALALRDALKDTELVVSAKMDAISFRGGDATANGQTLSIFMKVFSRVYAESDGTALESDRSLVSSASGGGTAGVRFVPILPSQAAAGSWMLPSWSS